MNDYAEFTWFIEKALPEAEKHLKAEAAVRQRFSRTLVNYLRASRLQHVYCLSLSEDSDVLSQWRAYADDGKGLAIGFSRKWLISLEPPVLLRMVSYEESQQQEIARSIVEQVLPEVDTDTNANAPQWAAIKCFVKLCCEAPTHKNPAFREEKGMATRLHSVLLSPLDGRG